MSDAMRTHPLFSACGLNCGLCPRYHTQGASKCPGCGGEGFLTVHPTCGILSCCLRKGLDYCFLCDDFPCRRYDHAGLHDSFITYKNQFADMDRAKRLGIDDYSRMLHLKMQILEDLLLNFDDGRRKSFFCLAVNLLDLEDINAIADRLADERDPQAPLKEKSKAAVRLFEETAAKKGLSLKLRKR